jgi:hypothetical protein
MFSYTGMIHDSRQPQLQATLKADYTDEGNNGGPVAGLKALSSV